MRKNGLASVAFINDGRVSKMIIVQQEKNIKYTQNAICNFFIEKIQLLCTFAVVSVAHVHQRYFLD